MSIPLLLAKRGFHPRQLFAALQGAWLEPTPGYIWQESTGVTPTTTGGQTIGKIADQSGGGHDATQATAANRPLLGRRYNLLTYSEQLATSPWISQGGGVLNATNNAGIAPNGSSTATALTPTATDSNVHRLNYNTTTGFFVTGSQYVFSVYLKKNGYDVVIVSNDSPSVSSIVNLTAGTATNGAVITNVGNDWYRLSLPAFTAGANVNLRINVFNSVSNASGLVSYTGDGTSGIYIWGADLRLTSDVGKDPAYQRITTATDYDCGQYPAAIHDTTDSLVVSLPDLGGGVYSAAGSVYFSTPVGMSALHNQSMGTTYQLPALSSDIYSWMVFPQRLNAAQESRLARYCERKAGIAGPDYFEQVDYGPELVTNGDFSNGTTGWTAANSGSLSVVSGAMRITNGADAVGYAYQAISTVAGKTYVLTARIITGTSANASVYVGTGAGGGQLSGIGAITTTGNYTLTFIAAGATTYINPLNLQAVNGRYTDFDNISVRELKDGMTGQLLDDNYEPLLMG